MGMPRPTVEKWQKGIQAPQLSSLLRICFNTGISPIDFLLGAIPNQITLNKKTVDVLDRKTQCPLKIQRQFIKISPEEGERIKVILEEALNREPPQCLNEVARKTGRKANTLKSRFPSLCSAIVTQYANDQKDCKQKLDRQMCIALEKAISEELRPLSLVEFAKKHEWSLSILQHRFPEKCRTLSERCAARRNKRWDEIEQALEKALNEHLPLSVKDFSRQHNVDSVSLYHRFRVLCLRLAKLHISHKKSLKKGLF